MCDNDHTDAEIIRREHAHEMGSDEDDLHWLDWSARAEAAIIAKGWDTKYTGGAKIGQSMGLDGDEIEDGYSIDSAYDSIVRGTSVEEYIADVAGIRSGEMASR